MISPSKSLEKGERMNSICRFCDTRIRLGICNGREGDFRYCFRRAGSIGGLAETITPFNTLDDLVENCEWLREMLKIDEMKLILSDKPYEGDEHIVLLYGVQEYGDGCGSPENRAPLGFVTR